MHQHFAWTPTNKSRIKSRFEVLYLTCKRCVDFWNRQSGPQQNLETLAIQLKSQQARSNTRSFPSFRKLSKRTLDEVLLDSHNPTGCQYKQTENAAMRKQTHIRTHSYVTRRDVGVSKVKGYAYNRFLPETSPIMPAKMSVDTQGDLGGMITGTTWTINPVPWKI